MKTDIFYYSGTGNSYLIAKSIAEGLPEARIFNIANLNSAPESINDKNCVLAFPVYGFSVPGVVKDFLKKLDFSQYGYFFVVSTKGGSPEFCRKDLSRIFAKRGKAINAFFSLKMPNNSYFVHDFNEPDDIPELLANARRFCDTAVAMIGKRENFAPDTEKMRFVQAVMFRFIHILAVSTGYMYFDRAFRLSDACVSCGICAKVCPSRKINLIDGRPSWKNGKKCYACTACINYCPHRAISNKVLKASRNNPSNQYFNPEISVSEIVRNNS